MRTIIRLAIGWALGVAAVAAAAQGVPLIKSRLAQDKEAATLDKRGLDVLKLARANKVNKSTDVVQMDADAALSTIISVTMPDGRIVVFRMTSQSTVDSNALSLDKQERDRSVPKLIWQGVSADGGELMLSVLNGEISYGEIHEGGVHYGIVGIGSGRQMMTRIDTSSHRDDATTEEMDKAGRVK